MRCLHPRTVSGLLMRSGSAALIASALSCAVPMLSPPQISLMTQLERSVEEYVMRPGDFVSIADRADWDLGERAQRPACTSWPCGISDATADMQIDAVRGLRAYGIYHTAGPHGTVIARVRNRGSVGTDSAFGARPGATVYVIAREWDRKRPLLFAHAQFVEVWSQGGELRARHIRNGSYQACPLHMDPFPPLAARFGGCTPSGVPHRMPTTIGGPAAFDLRALADPGPDGAGQTHCGPGCCEIE